MIYAVHIGDLSITFLENENQKLLFGGKGFTFLTSPRSKILEKDDNFPNQEGGYKAFTKISLSSFEVSESPYDPKKEPAHQKLVF